MLKEIRWGIIGVGNVCEVTFGDNSVSLDIDGKKKETLSFTMPKHIQQPLIQTIVNDLLGKGTCVSTGISGARTNKIMGLLTKK